MILIVLKSIIDLNKRELILVLTLKSCISICVRYLFYDWYKFRHGLQYQSPINFIPITATAIWNNSNYNTYPIYCTLVPSSPIHFLKVSEEVVRRKVVKFQTSFFSLAILLWNPSRISPFVKANAKYS